MHRFFSKLDLRDIKIDPEGSRFPPDADDHEEQMTADHHVEAAVEEPSVMDSAAWAPDIPSRSADAVVEVQLTEETVLHHEVQHVVASSVEDAGFIAIDCEVLKVSARSRPSAVAGAIAGVVREHGRAEVQAIGAGATNQAVKAVAIARDYLRETGIEAICLPAFIDVTIENEDRTAIRLIVEPR
jgi:stage V sporulation protein S